LDSLATRLTAVIPQEKTASVDWVTVDGFALHLLAVGADACFSNGKKNPEKYFARGKMLQR
jgi:hypothetical protein